VYPASNASAIRFLASSPMLFPEQDSL
jgi:hypothetical protein